MKFLLPFLCSLLLLFSQVQGQTGINIAPTTTIQQVSKFTAPGLYYFIVAPDTTDFSIDSTMKFTAADSASIINAYLKAHPCPVCPPPIICPPPVVCPPCPACPPPAKQRTAVSVTETITATSKTITITYDDGTTSTL